jgi:catechol 2,3-dioxygenase-like lactoylglutathione lyase family enzyme
MNGPAAPAFDGIHHVKLAVSELERALRFYQAALGASRVPDADHRHEDGSLYAYVVRVPGLGAFLELQLDPEQAGRHAHFESFAISVEDRAALEAWDTILTRNAVPHSPVLVAVSGWAVVMEDPDGNRVRLQSRQDHDAGLRPDEDSRWVRSLPIGLRR